MSKICQICNKKVEGDELYQNGEMWRENCGTVWPVNTIEIYGHKTCMENIRKLIVVPNRWDFDNFIKENKNKL